MTDARRRPLTWLLLLAAIFTIAAAGQVALGQANGDGGTKPADGDAAQPAEPEAAKPQPIAAADIAPEAEKVGVRLREITKLAEPEKATTDISEKLPATAKEISRLAAEMADAPPVSLRSVSSARQHWTGLGNQLDGWQTALQKRTTSLQDASDELDAANGIWTLTRNDELPEAVLGQVDAVLADIQSAKTAVSGRMEQVLTIQGQVSKQRESTSKAFARLDEIEDAQRSNLFVRDQDPLWQAMPRDADGITFDFKQSGGAIRTSAEEFFERYRHHLLFHAVVFIGIVVVIRLTRRSVSEETWPAEHLARVSIVLARPFSTALLISILVLRGIYPVTSSDVSQFARLIMLLPMLRMLPRLVPRFRWMFAILTVVYVAETLGQLTSEGTLLQRVILLASTGLAIAALGVGLAKIRRGRLIESTRLRRLVLVAGWVAVVGLIGSVIANVYGAMALANLLATALFNAIWAAIMLRVACNAVSAVLILLLRSPLLQLLQSVRTESEVIYRRSMAILSFGAVLAWLLFVLEWFQLRQPLSRWVEAVLTHEWAIGTLQISAGRIAAFVVAIVASVVVSRVVRFFLEEDVLSRLSLPRGAPATISTLVHYTIVAIGVVVALGASGMDLSKLGFIVGALGVGIGFGLQNVVNNFVSGLILIFERPVKVGDLIEVTGTMGNVTRIGARSSTIKTFAGAEVIVPNGNLISSEVINWTLSDQKRRTEVMIPVALGADGRRVVEILEAVAHECPDVLDDPEPYAAFQDFGEHGMMFVLRAWPSPDASVVAVRSALVADSLRALRDAGIDVPRPQREVHVRRADDTPGLDSPGA